MSIFRTIAMFLYLFGYMIVHYNILRRGERALAAGGEALWIWDGAERIGLGRVRGSELLAVAALLPGAGERCVRALAARCAGPEVRLTCAAENERAMRLYDRLGFSRGAEERVWFSI